MGTSPSASHRHFLSKLGRRFYSASSPIKLRDLYIKSRAAQKPNINECTCQDFGMTAFLTPLVNYEQRI